MSDAGEHHSEHRPGPDAGTREEPDFEGPAILNVSPEASRAAHQQTPDRSAPDASASPGTASTGSGSASAKDRETHKTADGGDDGAATRGPTPHLREIREIFRQLVIAEKNVGLYPAHSKVVKDSIAKLSRVTTEGLDAAGPLRLQVKADVFLWDEEVVFRDEERSRSLSFRIHKDGVREIVILPDVTAQELEAFVTCLKEARKVDEEEDDFITLFWERDCTHVQVQLADDFISPEELPAIPERRASLRDASVRKLRLPEEEQEKLKEAVAQRRAEEDDGENTFEITEEEALRIRELVENEKAYFPLFDFVDILLEVMVRKTDQEAFSRSVTMLRTILYTLVEDHDFERAALLVRKLSTEAHPGLSEAQRRQLEEMLDTLTDKQTLTVLETYLSESEGLASAHPVFDFMKVFPRSAVEQFCPFLRFTQHTAGVASVLVTLGAGSADTLARFLDDPDPLVVRAMIGVLLESQEEPPVRHIAKALRHPDEKVRVHAAKTILEKGDESVGNLFLPLLASSSKQLLNLALLFFTKHTVPESFDGILALVQSRRFHHLDQKRQRMCFKALLHASWSRGMDFIGGKVLRWPFCIRQTTVDKKSAALLALSSVESDQAKAIVERFAGRKRGPLRHVAQRCLKEIRSHEKNAATESREEVTRV